MLGLKRGVLTLSSYHVEWKTCYAEEKARLQAVIADSIEEIEHVGSTALPEMIAKPILDIAIRVNDLQCIEQSKPALIDLGYVYRGEQGIVGRHLFAKGDPVTHHVHIMLPDCSNWFKQVGFRDYLLKHPDIALEYAALKRKLISIPSIDRKSYSNGKAPFIERVLERALKERQAQE